MKRVHTPISAAVTISRVTGDEVRIRISIRDNASRQEFVEVYLNPADFAMAVTGLAMVDAKGSVCGLDHVGRFKETKSATLKAPSYNREEATAYVEAHGGEEGWFVDSYLGSRGSLVVKTDGTYAHYSLYRYVDKDPSTSP